MPEKEVDQQFVEYIVKQLVTKPDKVHTERKIDELGVLIELVVDREDMGVIIGKEGKTAKAVRTLLRVLGAKNDARINLKIVEPEGESGKKVEKSEEIEEVEEEAKEETAAEPEEDEAPMADLEL
ncbi:MAG: KH domain-containing protein [Patescibacteria group bacterium]|jgi:hypothetical protein|nr:KH domain-containing protein [Patescibacteria group bacterium]